MKNLKNAILIAKIVSKYEEVYLPIFERIHNQRQLRLKNENMLSVALSVAEQAE